MPENGWTKPGAKYVKRIPKPGGGFYYLYPEDIKAQARAKMNQAKAKINDAKKQVADKSGLTAKKNYEATKRQLSDVMRNTSGNFNNLEYRKTAGKLLNNQLRREKAEYENTALGKAEKVANKAKKTAKKAAVATADKIGLDERAAYKESQKGLFNPLTRAYKRNRYDETLAGKVERAAKPITDKVGKAAAAVKAMTGDNRVNRTSYTDMDGNTTHYVGQKGSKKVMKTVNKQKAIMYERDKQNVNKVKDAASAVSGLAKDAKQSIATGAGKMVKKSKEIDSKIQRALAIEDDVAKAKKKYESMREKSEKEYKAAEAKTKVKKAKKKVDKAIKKVKNRLKK